MNSFKIFAIICACTLVAACASENTENDIAYTEHSVENVNVFLKVEENPFLGRPTAITASSNGLYIVDSGRDMIHKVDRAGDLLMSFGSRGQGPGEYQSITGFWPLENGYLIYDYNSFKFITYDSSGEVTDELILRENPVNPDSRRAIPITVEALPSGKLLIPTGGSEGSLFAIADPDGDEIIFAGDALAEFVSLYNSDDVRESHAKGEVPDIFKNLVMLGSSSDVIYSLQQTTGILEKFTHDGQLMWSFDLNIPAQEGLADTISDTNIDAIANDGSTQLFTHARAMSANEDGVALLLTLPENQPTTFAWVPEDGSGVDLITVESLDVNPRAFMGMFALYDGERTAYHLERETGTVFQFEWPL